MIGNRRPDLHAPILSLDTDGPVDWRKGMRDPILLRSRRAWRVRRVFHASCPAENDPRIDLLLELGGGGHS